MGVWDHRRSGDGFSRATRMLVSLVWSLRLGAHSALDPGAFLHLADLDGAPAQPLRAENSRSPVTILRLSRAVHQAPPLVVIKFARCALAWIEDL
jgi:hypothetical protein